MTMYVFGTKQKPTMPKVGKYDVGKNPGVRGGKPGAAKGGGGKSGGKKK
jgi:hypothetical protein